MASFNKSINFRRTSIYPSITNNKFIPLFAHSNLLKSIFSKTIQPLSLSATSLSIHIFQKRVLPSHCHFYATTSTFLLYQSMANKDDKQIHHFGNEMSTYELAVSRLNALQSNAQVTAKLQNRKQITETNIQITKDCLQKLGISLDEIDQLNVVHITGTKGKGSTAAFLECILRSLGYKTGLYSSPHLVHVRERIRINGRPISEQYFAEQFFRVYNILQSKRAQNESMPAYFKFLTLLAFRIFCDQQVDVAIMEVGIGGEFDCTNVIQSPVVCAITTLDLDHTRLLGHTIPEIAWHKAGIAKPGSILLSVAQPPEALEVIKKRCSEKECQLLIVPSELTAYNWPQLDIKIGIPGLHHHLNVSLALQLASVWLQRMKGKRIEKNEEKILMNNLQMEENNFIDDDSPKELRGFGIPPAISEVLAECKWPGRSQLLQRGRILYHLDGAHTPQSLMACTKWFQQTSLTSGNLDNVFRVLIFHCTGDRDPTILLPKFKDCRINLAIFCPTRIDQKPAPLNQDNTNLTIDPESDMRRCERDKAVWTNLNESSEGNLNKRKCISLLLPSISDALFHVDELAKNNKDDIHVLVTGSFHLVGGVLSLLDPECATI